LGSVVRRNRQTGKTSTKSYLLAGHRKSRFPFRSSCRDISSYGHQFLRRQFVFKQGKARPRRLGIQPAAAYLINFNFLRKVLARHPAYIFSVVSLLASASCQNLSTGCSPWRKLGFRVGNRAPSSLIDGASLERHTRCRNACIHAMFATQHNPYGLLQVFLPSSPASCSRLC